MRNALSTQIVLFSLLLVSLKLTAGPGSPVKQKTFLVLENQPERVVFSLVPPDVQVQQAHAADRRFQIVTVPGYGQTTEPGFPVLPETAAFVQVPPGAQARLEILQDVFEDLGGIDVSPAPRVTLTQDHDAPQYQAFRDTDFYASNTFWPTEVAVLGEESMLRGRRVARVQMNPVQFNPVTHTLRVHRELTVAVRFSQPFPSTRDRSDEEGDVFSRVVKRLLLNPHSLIRHRSVPGSHVAQDTGVWYHPDFTYYKLFIETEGIYRLTYKDLVAAGVQPETLELSLLKLFSQGVEVPIWISGSAGITFGPENAILFYADRHRGETTFYDFYTDTSVYWLTADGVPGKRLHLMPDSLRSGSPVPFYWERLHLERENILHRSNASSVMEPDEGWIWRYFFPDSRERIPFPVSGLAEAATPCSLTVRLHGTSRDPVNPDHHVKARLNNNEVDEAFFDNNEDLIWTLAFDSALLHDGTNYLELHLVPDTGAEVNQIYLDWVEIRYPRMHATQHNTLKFTGTARPDVYAVIGLKDKHPVLLNPGTDRIWLPPAEKFSTLHVASAGFDDGNFFRAELDFQPILSFDRGHHLVRVDTQSGKMKMLTFDTFASAQTADEMAAYIEGLPSGTVVLTGIADEGSVSMTERAYDALASLGSALARQVGFRDSWAMIGVKGSAPGSVPERLVKHFDGTALVDDTLSSDQAPHFRVVFSDTAVAATYLAASDSGLLHVMRIEKDTPSDLHASSNAADYVVVSHRRFLSAAQKLARYRAEHDGLRAVAVDVQDVYDEFNTGVVSPHAIRDFLCYANENWQPPAPTFLVLFGDASWDPRHRLPEAVKTNYVPSYGILVTDNWYALLDGPGDVLPDMFVGRIPVETPEQAETVVDKLIYYDNLPLGSWDKDFVFLNGGIKDVEQRIFRSQAEILVKSHIEAAPLAARPILINKTTQEAITRSLLRRTSDRIREGAMWVNFMGHAGSSIWDIDIGLPDDWQNSFLPFMTGMSCHAARFANPAINSLGENFFINSRGAIAYWGSTGFGYITQDFFLLDGIFTAVGRDTVRSIGAATTLAKLSLWQRLGDQMRNRFVIDQYTLIGDPATQLALPTVPELAVAANDLTFPSEFLLTTQQQAKISARVHNYGLLPNDSVTVALDVTAPAGTIDTMIVSTHTPFGVEDSLRFSWRIAREAGPYIFGLRIDPQDVIPEADEMNNGVRVEVPVFSSDLLLVRPPRFGVVQRSEQELVSSNSKLAVAELHYIFEVDSSSRFDGTLLQRSPNLPEEKLVTTWRPQITIPGTYFWRVRSFDGENFGPWESSTFTYEEDGKATWQQSVTNHFMEGVLKEIGGIKEGVRLQTHGIILKAESGGFNEGSRALLWRNDEFLSLDRRGHNLAVLDGSDGRLLLKIRFDTFARATAADSLAALLNQVPAGKIILVAIRDEGSASMTESAYQALESIGSKYTRRVGFRDSWAIIGRKGAAIGSVPEVWSKSGDGPAVVADTLSRFAKSGAMTSVDIGPALAWKSAHFDYTSSFQNERIAFYVLGRPKGGAGVDTLIRGLERVSDVDLSPIDPARYPKIQLMAEMTSLTGQESPTLRAWSADFDPAADLVVDRNSLTVNPDSVQTGEAATATVEIGNFGLRASGPFAVRILAKVPGKASTEVGRFQAPDLDIDAAGRFTTPIETGDLLGEARLTVELDPEDKVPELVESNNSSAATLVVARDTLAPTIRVSFDGVALSQGEFVASRPSVAIEVLDRGQIPADSSHVTVLLDDQPIGYGPGEGEARLLPRQNPDDANLRLVAVFSPNLAAGEHTLQALARDATGNLGYFDADFFVSDEFVLGNVMNFPNPFRDATEFTYTLTQPADEVRIKVYTIAGRLILTLEELPANAGFNQFRWNGRDQDGDALANGVYLYKIIARSGNQQVELVEKLVVMR